MYTQAIDETELDYQRLADYKWVANSIEFSFRNENVSWTGHSHVASLPKEKQAVAIQLAISDKNGFHNYVVSDLIGCSNGKTLTENQ